MQMKIYDQPQAGALKATEPQNDFLPHMFRIAQHHVAQGCVKLDRNDRATVLEPSVDAICCKLRGRRTKNLLHLRRPVNMITARNKKAASMINRIMTIAFALAGLAACAPLPDGSGFYLPVTNFPTTFDRIGQLRRNISDGSLSIGVVGMTGQIPLREFTDAQIVGVGEVNSGTVVVVRGSTPTCPVRYQFAVLAPTRVAWIKPVGDCVSEYVPVAVQGRIILNQAGVEDPQLYVFGGPEGAEVLGGPVLTSVLARAPSHGGIIAATQPSQPPAADAAPYVLDIPAFADAPGDIIVAQPGGRGGRTPIAAARGDARLGLPHGASRVATPLATPLARLVAQGQRAPAAPATAVQPLRREGTLEPLKK